MFVVGRHSALFSMGFSMFTGVAYGLVIKIFKNVVERMKPTNDKEMVTVGKNEQYNKDQK